MTSTDFGTTPDGRQIRRFALSDGHIEVAVTDYGAALVGRARTGP